MKLLVLFVLAITMYQSSFLVDAASVISSETFGNAIRQRLLRGLNNNVRIARDTNEDNEEKRICYNTPCGWAVYDPITREIEYFMKNTCDCLDGYKCARVREDLSASAFVYRCRQNTTDNDILLEENL